MCKLIFIGVVTKQDRFVQWQTGTTRARKRVILGQAWVNDRRTTSNRARQRDNPGTRAGIKTRENRPKARQGKARQGKARQGKARQGKARQGKARQGKARQGKARQGKARQGKARQGKARQGKARQGKARQGLSGPCRVAIARMYAIQYSAEGKRKSMVYVGCVMHD